MLHDMAQEHRVELAVLGDDLLRLRFGQIAGVDVVALLAGEVGGDRIGFDSHDLPIAGATQVLHQRAVVAADIDGFRRILAGDCRCDQVVEMPRPLKARRIGVGLVIDQVGGNGVHDLQEAAVLAALEVDGEARIGILRPLPQIVGYRKFFEAEKM